VWRGCEAIIVCVAETLLIRPKTALLEMGVTYIVVIQAPDRAAFFSKKTRITISFSFTPSGFPNTYDTCLIEDGIDYYSYED
jgi:hypothetical protein